MQTILGSTGSVGEEIAKALPKYTDKIRLVSRNPRKVNDSDELFKADLTNAEQTDKAIAGSSVVYLTPGLEYKTSVWQEQWPKIMRNTLDSCARHGAKLVFFDNVYMYSQDEVSHLTEQSKVAPSSKKGAVRAKIAQMLLDDVKAGKLQALIARAPDFTSPKNSALVITVIDNFVQGKSGMLIGDPNKKHNFIFTPDAGKATALLGNTEDAYGQVWHLPSENSQRTWKQWIELCAKECGVAPKFSTLPKWSLGLMAPIIPYLGEAKEMSYQYYNDYFFDSSKFTKRFGDMVTKPEEQIRQLVASSRAALKTKA